MLGSDQGLEEEGGGWKEGHSKSVLASLPLTWDFTSSSCLSPPCYIVHFLFVDINDVLYQQVSLKAIDTMAIQHHLMSAGRTTETAAVHHHGSPSLKERWLNTRDDYFFIKEKCFQ